MRFAITGEVSHDRLSQPGMPTWEGLGGCATYLSLALGRLGGDVTFATVTGDNLDPAWLTPLRQAGVTLHLHALPGLLARLELAYDQNGDIARLRFEAGVESQMQLGHLSEAFWAADWVVVGTAPRFYQGAVAARARELGRSTALSTQREFEGAWESLAAILPHLSVLFINSGEVVGLRGDPLPTGLDSLRAANPHLTCVVTCASRGAFLLLGERLYHVAASPGLVVSTTGAGDAFAATWLLTLTRTGDANYALQAASLAGALALRGPAYTTIAGWDEIESGLKELNTRPSVKHWPLSSDEARVALKAEDDYCHRRLDRRVARS